MLWTGGQALPSGQHIVAAVPARWSASIPVEGCSCAVVLYHGTLVCCMLLLGDWDAGTGEVLPVYEV